MQVQISTLRKLLGPNAIATIPGRGYRFTLALDGIGDGGPTTAAPGAAPEPEPPGVPGATTPAGPMQSPPAQDGEADRRTRSQNDMRRRVTIADAGERRQLTILFADLVVAKALSAQLDPEVLRDVLASYQRVISACVDEYGGRVQHCLGDAVIAYFGHPEAHDNDAERAVLAGLALVAAVGRLTAARETRGEIGIQARVGVHTGLIVIGTTGPAGSPVELAVGEAPTVAARLGRESGPNMVCISDATRQLMGPQFRLRKLEPPTPSTGPAGFAETFAVDGGSEPSPDWEAGRNLTPLVGRDAELQSLMQHWNLAREKHGQAVLVSGEAGIGKSRLLAALRAQIATEEGAWRPLRCSPFHPNNALHPIIDLIERAIDAEPRSLPIDRAGTLRRLLSASGIDDEVSNALIASLLGLGDADVPEQALAHLGPMQRRQRTLDALIAWLHADAGMRPMVVVVDDLHWMDPSSLDLFGTLLERMADWPVLLVMTFRLDFVPPWPLRPHVSTIALSRLAPGEVQLIARSLTAGLELPAAIVEKIVNRTDGVPLFVEELTKAVMAAGLVVEREGALHISDDAAELFEVPASLRDSLTARLDRLGSAKAVAQLASVLGREFDYALLQAVCELPDAELDAHLATLSRADIVQQSGMPPHSHYRFKHALLQEAAYATLLKSARAQHHRRVAQAYVNRFPQVLQAKPELAAHHFGHASMPAEAVAYWRRAGEIALARSGHEEAISYLDTGLEQIRQMPASDARDAAELGLRVSIGPALLASKGFGAPEAGENYARACALSEAPSESTERFAAKWGDWLFKNTRGQLLAAAERSEELVALGRTLADDGYLLQAHHSRWTNFLFLGLVADARADTQEGLRLFDPVRHRNHKHLYGGHDPCVCARNFGAAAACAMGRADESRRLLAEARAISRGLNHTFSLTTNLMFGAMVFHQLGDPDGAAAAAEELLDLCERNSIAQWVGIGRAALGAALCTQGNTGAGLAMVEAGLELHLVRGPVGFTLSVLAIAARAHLLAGTPERALALLVQALELADRTKVGWQSVEVQRLKAEIELQVGRIDTDGAVARLHATADKAQTDGAAGLEARALTSMLRLSRDASRNASARRRLRVLCDSLDGHGSADIDAARAIVVDATWNS